MYDKQTDLYWVAPRSDGPILYSTIAITGTLLIGSDHNIPVLVPSLVVASSRL